MSERKVSSLAEARLKHGHKTKEAKLAQMRQAFEQARTGHQENGKADAAVTRLKAMFRKPSAAGPGGKGVSRGPRSGK